jgi:hypothetical protein
MDQIIGGNMGNQKINHVAVWILVVVHQIVVFLWYAEFLFGKKLMQLLGKTTEDFPAANPLNYIVAIITAIAMTYLLAWIFKELKIDTPLRGLFYALIIALSFFFLQTLTTGLFSVRSFGLTLIDGGMYLVNFLIAGIVLGAWKKYEVTEGS